MGRFESLPIFLAELPCSFLSYRKFGFVLTFLWKIRRATSPKNGEGFELNKRIDSARNSLHVHSFSEPQSNTVQPWRFLTEPRRQNSKVRTALRTWKLTWKQMRCAFLMPTSPRTLQESQHIRGLLGNGEADIWIVVMLIVLEQSQLYMGKNNGRFCAEGIFWTMAQLFRVQMWLTTCAQTEVNIFCLSAMSFDQRYFYGFRESFPAIILFVNRLIIWGLAKPVYTRACTKICSVNCYGSFGNFTECDYCANGTQSRTFAVVQESMK